MKPKISCADHLFLNTRTPVWYQSHHRYCFHNCLIFCHLPYFQYGYHLRGCSSILSSFWAGFTSYHPCIESTLRSLYKWVVWSENRGYSLKIMTSFIKSPLSSALLLFSFSSTLSSSFKLMNTWQCLQRSQRNSRSLCLTQQMFHKNFLLLPFCLCS